MGAVVAAANVIEGAVEVALDRGYGEAGGYGDVGQLHLVYEAEDEDAALTCGELRHGVPDEGHLLGGDEAGLDGGAGLGEVDAGVGDIDAGGGGTLPEAEALGTGVVAEEVDGNAHEPGGDGALIAEAGAGGPGTQEGVLGDGVGGVGVAS